MSFLDFFKVPFEQVYTNSLVVVIAMSLILFLISYSILLKVFKNDKNSVIIISLILSLFFFFYFENIATWISTFNIFLVVLVLAVFIFLGKPILRFLRINI